VVVSNSFETSLLSAFGSVPQDGIPLYPVLIQESDNVRSWKKLDGTVITNTPAPVAYDRDQWVFDHYSVPANLSAQALEDWMAERRLERKTLRLDLIRSVDVQAWLTAWSNQVANTLATLNSNDLGTASAVLLPDLPAFDLWVQVPPGIDYVGIYKTQDLLNPFPWTAVGTVDAPQSPMWVRVLLADADLTVGGGSGGGGSPGLPSGSSTNSPTTDLYVMEHVLLANHSLDSDGDGLLDAIEELLTGTDSQVADSDGDGLNDGDEVNLYGTNPLESDSDGDGISDFSEIANGTDPWNDDVTPPTVMTMMPASGSFVYWVP
jgi:hypothetical protein